MLRLLWSLFGLVFRLIATFTIFLLYGYVEKLFQSGVFVSIALGLYLMRYVSLWKALVILLSHLVACVYRVKLVIFFTFLALECLYFFSANHEADDTIVALKPYEKEIRQLLMKHNPDGLRKVDGLLAGKYNGKGKELWNKLRDKYEPGEVDVMSPSNNLRHEEIYNSPSNAKDNHMGKEEKFEIRNPLSEQVAKQQLRSQYGRDNHLPYSKIYEEEEIFEDGNPMVIDDSPNREDSSLPDSILQYRGSKEQPEENPLYARTNSLRGTCTTPFTKSNSIRKVAFDQSTVEQAKREAQENARRRIDELYGTKK